MSSETKEEFEKSYAERSGMPLERLYQLGGHGEFCDCQEEGCKGWKMMFPPVTGEG